ncbi:MAG: DUF4105 domain-containing protein, partial [Gammaproteobacteria bacterium]|nr:DUF4105 domain-containing protein [Gammaproteobacteria bacterium]
MLSDLTTRAVHLLLLVSLVVISTSASSNNDYITELQNQALEKQLWRERVWINLLHYDVNDAEDYDYVSQVDDDRFFNADDGKTDPRAELVETIAAFFRTDLNGNEHPRCRFIARLAWLQQQLSIDESALPVMDCKDFKQWYGMVKADHITMVFPAYHLNSPSSMFGHTLLRMDKKFGNNESEWLSFAVNFGAETNA